MRQSGYFPYIVVPRQEGYGQAAQRLRKARLVFFRWHVLPLLDVGPRVPRVLLRAFQRNLVS
jgi:hypothetical protein